MVGAMEKGVAAAKLAKPPVGTYEGVDLRLMPRFICFRAAMLREKMLLQYFMLILVVAFAAHYAFSQRKINGLYGDLRTKEYILAPGVQDFMPASPQTVSDSYITHAVTEFINRLGNINPVNVDEQYRFLSESMSPNLSVRFEKEAAAWRDKVKRERLSEVLTVVEREIVSDDRGRYRALARTSTDSYINQEHVGSRDEVIEMKLRLVPPEQGRRWFLEITDLSRSSLDSYRLRQSSEGTRQNREAMRR